MGAFGDVLVTENGDRWEDVKFEEAYIRYRYFVYDPDRETLQYTSVPYSNLKNIYPGLDYDCWSDYIQSPEGEPVAPLYNHFFYDVFSYMYNYVYKSLSTVAVVDSTPFSHLRIDPRMETTRLRVDIIVTAALIFDYILQCEYYSPLCGFLHVWFYMVEQARTKLLEKYKNNLQIAPTIAKERFFTKSSFPLDYQLSKNQDSYGRLFPINSVSWQHFDKQLEKKPIVG